MNFTSIIDRLINRKITKEDDMYIKLTKFI